MAVRKKDIDKIAEETQSLVSQLEEMKESKDETLSNAQDRNASEDTISKYEEQISIIEEAISSLEEAISRLSEYE